MLPLTVIIEDEGSRPKPRVLSQRQVDARPTQWVQDSSFATGRSNTYVERKATRAPQAPDSISATSAAIVCFEYQYWFIEATSGVASRNAPAFIMFGGLGYVYNKKKLGNRGIRGKTSIPRKKRPLGLRKRKRRTWFPFPLICRTSILLSMPWFAIFRDA